VSSNPESEVGQAGAGRGPGFMPKPCPWTGGRWRSGSRPIWLALWRRG